MTNCSNDKQSTALSGKRELPPEEIVFLKRTSFGIAPANHYEDGDRGDLARFNAGGVTMAAKIDKWLEAQFTFPKPPTESDIPGIKDPTGFITLGLSNARMGPENMRNIKYELKYSDVDTSAKSRDLFIKNNYGQLYCLGGPIPKPDDVTCPAGKERRKPLDGWTRLGYTSEQEQAYRIVAGDKAHQIEEMRLLTFQRAVYSRFQLFERLTMFWKDHFNVMAGIPSVGVFMASWDVAIRQHIMGNFYQLLLATAEHPAMLYYLDNFLNSTGNPNENYAREVIELHTLGAMHYHGLKQPNEVEVFTAADGVSAEWIGKPKGYVDADVYEAAEMLTGWHVTGSGNFIFNRKVAGKNEVSVLKHTFPSAASRNIALYKNTLFDNPDGSPVPIRQRQGRFLLHMLATHPSTAKHIAYKLVKHFVSDQPPEALINKVRDTFLAHVDQPDQLKQCYLTLFKDPIMRDSKTWGQKLVRPYELMVSAFRSGGCQHDFYGSAPKANFITGPNGMRRTGQTLHSWPSPDGHPHDAEDWINTASMTGAWGALEFNLRDGVGAFVNYDGRPTDAQKQAMMRIVPITIAHFDNDVFSDKLTPANVVTFWATRVWGFTPSDKVLAPFVTLFCQPKDTSKVKAWDKNQPIYVKKGEFTGSIVGNDIHHRWIFKLSMLVFALSTHPYAMLR